MVDDPILQAVRVEQMSAGTALDRAAGRAAFHGAVDAGPSDIVFTREALHRYQILVLRENPRVKPQLLRGDGDDVLRRVHRSR